MIKTKQEMVAVGLDYIAGKYKDEMPKITWDILNERHGRPFKSGEQFRGYVKNFRKRNNMIISPEINAIQSAGDGGPQLDDGERLQDIYERTGAGEVVEKDVEILANGHQRSTVLLQMDAKKAKNKNFLLEKHGYDIQEWEVVTAKNNIWNIYSKQDGIQVLYASKITVKPRNDSVCFEEIKAHYEEMLKSYTPPKFKPTNYSKDGKLLEVNIADLHVGKLSWAPETGENYDIKIAKERFRYIINDIVTRNKNTKFNRVLFVWANDFFHYDSIGQTTTAGTPQDSDVRWQKLYLLGLDMLIEAIDCLSKLAPVTTFYVGSNHDKMTSYYANTYLYAWYRKNSHVTIDMNPRSRKYFEFGKCLIGFAHGDEEKSRISGIMPNECKGAWGRTDFHEMHCAHFHKEKATVNEDNGVIVRYISSPTGTDAWHFASGFVGAIKKAQCFVWDKDYGLTDIMNTTIIIPIQEACVELI